MFDDGGRRNINTRSKATKGPIIRSKKTTAKHFMQTIRNRAPQVFRVSKAVPINYTPTRKMSFFPASFVGGEFAPLFRLLDDYASHSVSRGTAPASRTSLRSFQPRFDVKESKDGYELQGEMPGVDPSNINIEFTDAQTLTIKGHSERYTESGTPPAALEGQQEQARITSSDAESTISSNYHKPSVEEDGATSTTTGADTPTSSAADTTVSTQTAQPPVEQSQHKYWVSDRSIGEFQRTFSFPSRVDQDNVKASLRNGILSVIVPKAAAPVSKRITIE